MTRKPNDKKVILMNTELSKFIMCVDFNILLQKLYQQSFGEKKKNFGGFNTQL